jgi:hypothetical protein
MLPLIEHLVLIGQTWTGAIAILLVIVVLLGSPSGAAWTRYRKFVVLGSRLRSCSERDRGPTNVHCMWVKVGFHYRQPPNKVKRILLDAFRGTPRVRAEPEPDCLLLDFADSAITYALTTGLATSTTTRQSRPKCACVSGPPPVGVGWRFPFPSARSSYSRSPLNLRQSCIMMGPTLAPRAIRAGRRRHYLPGRDWRPAA